LGLTAALECARQDIKCRLVQHAKEHRWNPDVRRRRRAAGDPCGNDILVCMLPQTPHTRGLLDAGRLAMLKPGTAFVNVSRGSIVDEQALIAALQSGHIAEATLDVFATEPLPASSPLWDMDNVLITPHLASIALPASAAVQIGDNVRRLRAASRC